MIVDLTEKASQPSQVHVCVAHSIIYLLFQAMSEFSFVLVQGRFLIEQLPWLKYIPSWMPGAGFKRLAAKFRKSTEDLYNVPFAFVQDKISKGEAQPSFVHDLLANEDLSAEQVEYVKLTAGSFFAGM